MKLLHNILYRMNTPLFYGVLICVIAAATGRAFQQSQTLPEKALSTPRPAVPVQPLYTIQGTETQTLVTSELIKKSGASDIRTGIVFQEGTGRPDDTKVSRWNEYLIQVDAKKYSKAIKGSKMRGRSGYLPTEVHNQLKGVNIYNTNTGEKFSISFDKPINDPTAEYWGGHVAGDGYYFGAGGEFGLKINYKINLPPERGATITKLAQTLSGTIQKHGNYHYIFSCYEGCSFGYIDLNTLSIIRNPRISSINEYDLAQKERSIGFDHLGRILMVQRDTSHVNMNDPITEGYFPLIEIGSIEPTTGVYSTVVSANQLPEEVFGYTRIGETDHILLVGKNIYAYNMSTQSLLNLKTEDSIRKKLERHVSEKKPFRFYNAQKGTEMLIMCAYNNGWESDDGYIVDLKNRTFYENYSDGVGACEDMGPRPNHIKELGLDEKFYAQATFEEHLPITIIDTDVKKNQIPEGFKILNEQ